MLHQKKEGTRHTIQRYCCIMMNGKEYLAQCVVLYLHYIYDMMCRYRTFMYIHTPHPNLITGKLHNHFASITAMFFWLTIITYKG